jgi:hypothetical protein
MFIRIAVPIALALAVGAGSALSQGAQRQSTRGGSVELGSSLAALTTTHDGLAARFRQLGAKATAANATVTDRQALARFVRAEVVPHLEIESVALFPAFDSIIGGGYAVPATLFDLDAISFLIQEVERTATVSAVDFGARVYALSSALETYFTKTQLLVLPVLHERLKGPALDTVLARLADRSAP